MREITDHIVEGDSANHQLSIRVLDEPGAGGANHIYSISWKQLDEKDEYDTVSLLVRFQNGPIKESGVNGITQEALLAIVIDRLRCFQAGPFACLENDFALSHCELALSYLQERTRERIKRNVEGTNTL